MKRKLLTGLMAVSIALGGCSGNSPTAAAPSGPVSATYNTEEKEYVIGVALPITGKGSTAGKMEIVGATLAVNEINAAGGVNGVPLRLDIVDTASDPKEAANAVRKLASENVLAILGPHYSNEAEVSLPIGKELGVVQILPASSKPGVVEANRPYSFRNMATEDKTAREVLIKWVVTYDIKTVVIINDIKDSVSQNLGEAIFPAIFEELGVTVLTKDNSITFQTGDVDFSAQITKAQHMGADGIALGALAADALNIMTKAREQGLSQPFVGGAPMLEGEIDKKGGEDVQGTFSGSPFWVQNPDEKVQAFVQGYQELAPTLYPGISRDPLHYSANAYDSIKMLAKALLNSEIGNTPETLAQDRDAIRNYLAKMDSFPEGIASNGFTAQGDGIKDIIVLKVEGKEWVRVE